MRTGAVRDVRATYDVTDHSREVGLYGGAVTEGFSRKSHICGSSLHVGALVFLELQASEVWQKKLGSSGTGLYGIHGVRTVILLQEGRWEALETLEIGSMLDVWERAVRRPGWEMCKPGSQETC